MKTMIVGVTSEPARDQVTACAVRMGVAEAVTTVDHALDLLDEHRRRATDLVLADTCFAGPDPVAFTDTLRAQSNHTDILLTGKVSPRTAGRIMAAGARALFHDPSLEPEQLTVSAARAIILTWPRASRDHRVRADPSPRPAGPALTEREIQVLRGMSEGKTNPQIAFELYLSVDTIKTHSKRLYRKLGVHDRAHAVAEAFRLRLIC